MRSLFPTPKMNLLRLVLILTLSSFVVSESGCVQEKPGCGSKRDHRVRKRRVHKFAPSMGYRMVTPVNKAVTCLS